MGIYSDAELDDPAVFAARHPGKGDGCRRAAKSYRDRHLPLAVRRDRVEQITDALEAFDDYGASSGDVQARQFEAMKAQARAYAGAERKPEAPWMGWDAPMGVAFLGDVHAGGAGVAYDAYERDLARIAATPGLHLIGMGDYTDNFNPRSRAASGMYHAANTSPDVQFAYVEHTLEAVRGKLLAICQGNHDAWSVLYAGLDPLIGIAARLGIPGDPVPYFDEGGGTVRLRVGEVDYVLAVKHEYGGKPERCGQQAALAAIWPAEPDVVCLGHLHYNQVGREPVPGGKHRTYLRCGSYKVIDDYARKNGYTPEYGVPVAIFYPDQRRVVAFPGDQMVEALAFLASERARYGAGG